MNDEEKAAHKREMGLVFDDLKRALIPPTDEDVDLVLTNHLKVLDLAFRDKLNDSYQFWDKAAHFANALKAHSEYRSTLKIREAIRKQRTRPSTPDTDTPNPPRVMPGEPFPARVIPTGAEGGVEGSPAAQPDPSTAPGITPEK
jgi:hypothetical protein